MSVALSVRALEVLKEFPKILDELAAGVHVYTKWADRSKGILTRGKELRRGKRDSSKKELQVQRRTEERELLGKTGSQNWSLARQEKVADERARAVIKDLKNRYISRPYTDKEGLLREGTAYFLTTSQEAKLKELLYPIKLKEIQEGTPYIQRLTIGHRYPNVGVFDRGGELKGRGFTTWENITDDAGNLNLVPMLDNIRASNIIPDEFRALAPTAGVSTATGVLGQSGDADASILAPMDAGRVEASRSSSQRAPSPRPQDGILYESFLSGPRVNRRKKLIGEKLSDFLPYATPLFTSLTGPFSRGARGSEQGWRKSLLDPTWPGKPRGSGYSTRL